MNRVEVNAIGIEAPLWTEEFIVFAVAALRALGKRDWSVSVLFCGDEFIAELNWKYRNVDGATDVLSFSQSKEWAGPGAAVDESEAEWEAGDIVISLGTSRVNAEASGVSLEEEVRKLFVHGALHLDGLDHEDPDESAKMFGLQDEILARCKGDGSH